MKEDQEKWIDAIFHSMKDSERALPNPDLFNGVMDKISISNVDLISLKQWKIFFLVSILIIAFNAIALNKYSNLKENPVNNIAAVDTYQGSLISSYQLYD